TPAPAPTTPAPAPTTPAPKPKPKPKPKPPAPKPPAGDTTNWKLRNSILAYGRQFMGTPYVWGGKSPAGWDCIGFAHYVYAHHGIQIAYSSHGAQFNGVRVSKADARPGDLLWWPGHVGIYTGNGMHMAAANPRAGTKEDVIWGNPQYRNVIGD
ncbi:MAG: NlpC/P60 family protein, partial [Flaviflexus sp.]|nr:NlpC/P60 family protein [Flaviflexus sp.]